MITWYSTDRECVQTRDCISHNDKACHVKLVVETSDIVRRLERHIVLKLLKIIYNGELI